VVAALIDGVDVVVTTVPGPVPASIVGRLAARARQRGSVLVPFGAWSGADVTLQVSHGQWEGLGDGWGRLRRREVTVVANGRGAAARPKELTLWMPGLTARPGAPTPRPTAPRTHPEDPASTPSVPAGRPLHSVSSSANIDASPVSPAAGSGGLDRPPVPAGAATEWPTGAGTRSSHPKGEAARERTGGRTRGTPASLSSRTRGVLSPGLSSGPAAMTLPLSSRLRGGAGMALPQRKHGGAAAVSPGPRSVAALSLSPRVRGGAGLAVPQRKGGAVGMGSAVPQRKGGAVGAGPAVPQRKHKKAAAAGSRRRRAAAPVPPVGD
jgi:hypothetical protein